ncbi:MAG: hypothetical protein AAF004_15105 [Pseudomonadota bacterium]
MSEDTHKTDEEYVSDVMARQSIPGVLFGSAIGAVVGAMLFATFGGMGATLVVLLLLPAAVVGFGAKFVGQPIGWKLRLIPATVALILHGLGSYLLFPSAIAIGLTPVSFAIAWYFSKAAMSQLEEKALWRQKHGFPTPKRS